MRRHDVRMHTAASPQLLEGEVVGVLHGWRGCLGMAHYEAPVFMFSSAASRASFMAQGLLCAPRWGGPSRAHVWFLHVCGSMYRGGEVLGAGRWLRRGHCAGEPGRPSI